MGGAEPAAPGNVAAAVQVKGGGGGGGGGCCECLWIRGCCHTGGGCVGGCDMRVMVKEIASVTCTPPSPSLTPSPLSASKRASATSTPLSYSLTISHSPPLHSPHSCWTPPPLPQQVDGHRLLAPRPLLVPLPHGLPPHVLFVCKESHGAHHPARHVAAVSDSYTNYIIDSNNNAYCVTSTPREPRGTGPITPLVMSLR